MTNIIFILNSANFSGGALFSDLSGSTKITNAIFIGNIATIDGGGALCFNLVR